MSDFGATSHWSTSRAAALGGALLALLVAVALVGFAWYERREALAAQVARGELLARVLEDHATRVVETGAVALTALGAVVDAPATADERRRTEAALAQALVGLPFMRSIALLDEEGRVIASTVANESDQVVDPAALGILPPQGQDALGRVLPGRQLTDLARTRSGGPVASRHSFVPLVRRLRSPLGEDLLLVGLINPDSLANYQQLALSDDRGLALLASYQGSPLSVVGSDVPVPTTIGGHPVFRELLAMQEHGSYIGHGFGDGPQIVAFRASRSRPLVVIVEHSEASALASWSTRMRWLALGGSFAEAFIVVMAWTAWRSLRAREAARQELDAAQGEALRRERELSVTVKSLQELIFRTDTDARLTFVSERWYAVDDESPEQALGRRLRDMVGPAHRADVDSLFAVDEASGVRTALVPIRSRRGALRHFDIAVAPLRGRGGVVGFAGSAVDVTDRRAAEQQLQAQLALTGLLIEISPVPVSMSDRQGRFITVNQSWEDFHGRFRGQVIGQAAYDGLPEAEARMHAEQDARLLASSGRVRYEARMSHGDGSQRDVVVTKVLVPDESGQAAGILSTIMDVSEFREAERATREARDSAEEASRAKSEFIANISHELRTPLQSILGFSEIGMVRAKDHERLGTMFHDIHASGARMLALVNDLLDVAKIESTVGTFHVERTDVRSLIRTVIREIDPLLQGQQLHVNVALPPAPMIAKVDPLRFQQVIRNVLANAIKFSPRGQTVALTGDVGPGPEIRITVRDHGPGIPPSELDAIFEAFVQSSATKTGAGGTGLGLAICRKIVEAHGGHISAGNAVGGGAQFEIILPSRGSTETFPMPMDSVDTRRS